MKIVVIALLMATSDPALRHLSAHLEFVARRFPISSLC